MKPITLYTFALSPFGMKVYWALVLKKLPFSLVYVSPRTAQEISFTQQKTVPVLQIGDEWRLDSTTIIHWLDELFPETPLSGKTPAQQALISSADSWATDRLIPAFFRHSIDSENFLAMIDTGWKLASTMSQTSGGVPFFLYPIWPYLLRTAGFIQCHAKRVSVFPTLVEMDNALISELEQLIDTGPFLGGLETPSIGDAAAYAQLFAIMDLGMKGWSDFRASKKIHEWLCTVESFMKETNKPPLYPDMGSSVVNSVV